MMKGIKITIMIVCMLSLLVFEGFTPIRAYAQEPNYLPRQIKYQGVLQDEQGRVFRGKRQVTFSIYESEKGRRPLWNETQVVNFIKGRFTVILGAINPVNLSEAKPYYLGVHVDSYQEILPRQILVSEVHIGSGGRTISAGEDLTTDEIMLLELLKKLGGSSSQGPSGPPGPPGPSGPPGPPGDGGGSSKKGGYFIVPVSQLQSLQRSCSSSDGPYKSFLACNNACQQWCANKGYTGGTMVGWDGKNGACTCIP